MDNQNCGIVIGKKQILRLARENKLKCIQLAVDADAEYVSSIVAAAKAHNIRVFGENTREELARKYGIEVPCGGIGFLKTAD